MEFKEDTENNVSRSGSLFGAIFMCNRSTKKECLERSLFGLPPPQINFVKKVKVGMLLFLFEYEERKLYGVYQASSDGAVNIVPQAFKSLGKQIPAQIRVKKIWNCVPLSEPDFHDALRDNYYAPKKFNFGLSEDQVRKLLFLFSARKLHRQQQNPMARVIARKQNAKSGLGRTRLSNEGRCLTKNGADTSVGLHNDTQILTKYLDLSGSGLKNHSGNYDIGEREYCRKEDQHRLAAVAPNSMQPQIPNFCSPSQDNQHFATSYGNSYLSRDPRLPSTPFGVDHSVPSILHAPEDSLFQQSGGQVVPSHSESQNLVNFSARQHLEVFSSSSFPAKLHSPEDSFFQQSRGQVIPSHLEPQNLVFSSRQQLDVADGLGDYLPLDCQDIASHVHTSHDQDVPNYPGDYIPLSCNENFEPLGTGIIFPETDCFGDKRIDSSDFEEFKRLFFHEPPSATIPFPRTENYGRENPEEMKHWNYEPSTAAMSMSSEQKFHPHGSVRPLDLRGVEPDGDHNGYRSHLGQLYEPQNTGTNYCHEDYEEQLELHHDSRNAKTNDCKYEGMYCDTRRDSVFSRLTMPQETITGDDDEKCMDKGDTVNMSVDQLMEFLYQNQSHWGQLTERPHQLIGHCNYDNIQVMKIRGSEMSEDAGLIYKEDKSRKRVAKDDILLNFKRRSEAGKLRNETVTASGTPGKRRKLRRPSFGTVITEEGNGNSKQTQEEIFLEPKTNQVDASVREADDRLKPEDQSLEIGSNATSAVSFGGGDSATVTEQKKLLLPPSSTCESKELSFGTIITEEDKGNSNQTQEEILLEPNTNQVDASIRETDDRLKPEDQSLEIGNNATSAVSFGGGDSATVTEQKKLLLPPSSTCETKELSFGTIITEEGKENGKQTQDETYLESKTIQVDTFITEANDRVKLKDQFREIGRDATAEVPFSVGDSVKEIEQKELMLPPSSTCGTKEPSG